MAAFYPHATNHANAIHYSRPDPSFPSLPYGKQQGAIFGPMYDSHRIQGGTILVKFKHTGSGLKTNDEAAPNWFEISDGTKDRNRTVYVRAQAKIVGPDTVAVSAHGNRAEGASVPKHVRFGWHNLARFNLINQEGLPAVSFRTDDEDN